MAYRTFASSQAGLVDSLVGAPKSGAACRLRALARRQHTAPLPLPQTLEERPSRALRTAEYGVVQSPEVERVLRSMDRGLFTDGPEVGVGRRRAARFLTWPPKPTARSLTLDLFAPFLRSPLPQFAYMDAPQGGRWRGPGGAAAGGAEHGVQRAGCLKRPPHCLHHAFLAPPCRDWLRRNYQRAAHARMCARLAGLPPPRCPGRLSVGVVMVVCGTALLP